MILRLSEDSRILQGLQAHDDGFRRLKTKEQNALFPSLVLYLACQKPTWPRIPRMAVHQTPQKVKDYPKKTPRVLIVQYSLNYNHCVAFYCYQCYLRGIVPGGDEHSHDRVSAKALFA
jgi:hypothetical protein